MRIWAFPYIYPYDKPGMAWNGIFAHRQYKGLIENGADLKVILPVPWHPPFPFYLLHPEWKKYAALDYPEQSEYEGVTIYYPRIANMKPNRFVKKSFLERYADSVANLFKKNKIVLDRNTDIFYSQWLPASAQVQYTAHRLGVKSAILAIGDDVIIYPHEKKENFEAIRKTLEEADMRFVVADYLGKEANKLVGHQLPYDVIFMGVDYDLFKPVPTDEVSRIRKQYNIPPGRLVVLTVASPIVRKGWLDLFDALQQVKKVNDNFVQVAVHAGYPEIDLDTEVRKRGLTQNFLNLGEVKPTEVNKLFKAADIFCLASHWEGMANVVIEGMASQLPVITTDVCGHPEIITDGVNGLLVPPKQPGVLAEKLISLLQSKEKRDYLAKNAREFIVTKWGNFPENVRKLYIKLNAANAV